MKGIPYKQHYGCHCNWYTSKFIAFGQVPEQLVLLHFGQSLSFNLQLLVKRPILLQI